MSETSRVRFTPSNPGPVANSFARYVIAQYSETYPELKKLSPAIAQALFSYHGEWQRARNAKGGEADQEKAIRKEQRAAKVREQSAKRIEAAKKLLAEAGIAVESAKSA